MSKVSNTLARKQFQARLDRIKVTFRDIQLDVEYWNRTHPDEEPLPTETFEDFLKETGLINHIKIKEGK